MYRGISDFKKGYQPRTNIVKHVKGDLVAEPQVFWLCEEFFSQLWNVHVVNDVRQTDRYIQKSR